MYHEVLGPKDPCSKGLCACILVGSYAFFSLFAQIIQRHVTPKSAQHSLWKWRNISISMLHSTISGAWTVYGYVKAPGVFEDLVNLHSLCLYHVGFFSLGYFMYDFLDVLTNSWRTCKGVLLHHVVASFCMYCSYISRCCVSYTNLGLLYEVSSVFLHLRYLSKIVRIDVRSLQWKITAALNIGVFVIFRYCVFVYMIYWLYLNINNPDFTTFWFCIYTIANLTGFAINSVLFHTCLSKDFRPTRKERVRNDDSHHVSSSTVNSSGVMNGSSKAELHINGNNNHASYKNGKIRTQIS